MFVRILKLLLSFVSEKTKLHVEVLEGTHFEEVRVKSKLWLTFNSAESYMTIGETLYVHPERWRLESPNSTWLRAIMQHENVHLMRQYAEGLDPWIWKYLTNKKFRWEEEKYGYAAEFKYNIEHGAKYTDASMLSIAETLSGPGYGNMTTLDEAHKWVKETITTLEGK